MALTKAELRQRRWVKQRISYLESDNGRIIKLLSDRVSDLENLLRAPSLRQAQLDTERSEVVSCQRCIAAPQAPQETWDEFMRRHRRFHWEDSSDQKPNSGVD